MLKLLNFSFVLIAACLISSGCGSDAQEDAGWNGIDGSSAVQAAGSKGTGVISGKAVLEGKAPAPADIDMSGDFACRSQHPLQDETALQNPDGTLRNVFVYVKSGAGKYPAPKSPVVLEQKGCVYKPHVVGVQVGQVLEIVNSDPTLHNVHCVALLNNPFNFAQPNQGMKSDRVFSKPEVMLKMKCDVHGWMSGYVGVVGNPFFAVTGTDGSFKISGLPAGTYLLEAWHEKYGTLEQAVTVKQGETQSADFSFQVKRP
jgi:plastocyanin